MEGIFISHDGRDFLRRCHFQKDPDMSDTPMWISFFIFYCYYVIVFLAVGYWTIKKILEMRLSRVVNVYRIIQLFTLLFYLITSITHISLKFLEGYQFHNNGGANLILFLFLISEAINVSSWVNLLVHLRSWVYAISLSDKSKDKVMAKFNKSKRYEKIVISFVFLLVIFYLWWNFGTIAYSFMVPNWRDWKPFYEFETSNWERNEWHTAMHLYQHTFFGLAIFGVLIGISKIVTGWILLYILKNHLNNHFYKRRWSIILSMIASWIIISNRTFYNLYKPYRTCDLKYNFVAREAFPAWQAPFQIIITALGMILLTLTIDITLPIIIMIMNIHTIDFKKFLETLIKAWGLERYIKNASIFVKYKYWSTVYGASPNINLLSMNAKSDNSNGKTWDLLEQ